MLNKFFSRFEDQQGSKADPESAAKRQKNVSLWVAGIFTIIGLAFFLYDLYTVFIIQKGRFDVSDSVLMPVTALMFLVAVASIFLIQRNRFSLGTGLLFYFFVLVPPILTVLLLQGVVTIAVLYVVLLASILIFWVLPSKSRGWEVLAAVAVIVVCVSDRILESQFPYPNRSG